MKIFITGIAGFLGRHLAQRFLDLGFEVEGNDTLIGGFRENVPDGAALHLIDCCNFDQMKKAINGSDIVIHAAATAHEGLSVFSPSFITRNIFEASVSTFSAAISQKVRRIVFCTSMARYGSQLTPFTEDMDTAPQDPYGIAKVGAEQVLKVLADTHDVEYNIAVPHNIVGPYQCYTDPYRNVMSIMLNRNLLGKPAIIYGDGTQTRCFSYVDDCIQCLERIALDPGIVREIINIGPDEEFVTINDLAQACANETGMNEDPIYYVEGRPQEVKHAVCSSDKARRLLQYETTTSFRDSVKYTADYIRARGPREFRYTYPLEIVNEKTPKTWSEKRM